MKVLSLITLALVLLGCPDGMGRVYDSFQGMDRTLPNVLSYGLKDNSTFSIIYDKTVVINDAELDGKKLKYSDDGTIFSIPLGKELTRGEKSIFSLNAEDMNGNTLRSSFIIVGKNEEIPKAVINELSIQGSGDSPDRVEILFLEDGNTAGMVLCDGTEEGAQHSYIFPEIDVESGDMLLIYWDEKHKISDTITDKGHTAYVVDAESETTLSGTNGALILYAETGGKIMDGIVYTTGDNANADGYGNTRTKEAAQTLFKESEWSGDPVDSTLVTSSRVIARRPNGWDTNTNEDFFITAARKSTFGYHNEYFPYEP